MQRRDGEEKSFENRNKDPTTKTTILFPTRTGFRIGSNIIATSPLSRSLLLHLK